MAERKYYMNFRLNLGQQDSGLDKLIKKIDDTGGTNRTNGSGRFKLLNPRIGQKQP